MLDEYKQTFSTERTRRLTALRSYDWNRLAGSELAKRDQLDEVVLHAVRPLVMEVLALVEKAERNEDAFPPHLLVFLNDDVLRAAFNVCEVAEAYNRRRLQQGQSDSQIDKVNITKRILQECTSLDSNLLLFHYHALAAGSREAFVESAQLKHRLAESDNVHRETFSRLEALHQQAQSALQERLDQVLTSQSAKLKELEEQCAARFETLRRAQDDLPERVTAVVKTIEEEHAKQIREAEKRHVELFDQLQSKIAAFAELETRSTAIHTEAKSLLATTRDTAARATADQQATEFDDARKHHESAARVWFGTSAGLVILVLLLVAGSMYYRSAPPLPDQPWTAAANLSYFAARALAMSVLSFLLVVGIRNYRSAKHNAVTNGHRANALRTFPRLRDVAGGRTQDFVLLQMTTAIFSPQPSGYVDAASGPGTHVNELIKTLRPDEGGGNPTGQA